MKFTKTRTGSVSALAIVLSALAIVLSLSSCGGGSNAPEPYTAGEAESSAQETTPLEQNNGQDEAEAEEDSVEAPQSAEADDGRGSLDGPFADEIALVTDNTGLFGDNRAFYGVQMASEDEPDKPVVRLLVPVDAMPTAGFGISYYDNKDTVPNISGESWLEVLQEEHVESAQYFPYTVYSTSNGGWLNAEIDPAYWEDGSPYQTIDEYQESLRINGELDVDTGVDFVTQDGIRGWGIKYDTEAFIFLFEINSEYTLAGAYQYGLTKTASAQELIKAIAELIIPVE